MPEFSHLDKDGRAHMVDVSQKPETTRQAIASGLVKMSPETIQLIRTQQLPKGDPFETARIAGILAAKQTATLIPLCHPLPLSHIDINLELIDEGIYIKASVLTRSATGVEMEALTAVSLAALTVYDMCKAVEKTITITNIQLESKTGGKSGDWQREK
ncbi:MAG: cyclic pyranopterin monophosphate synthase MoaC [Acidobacteria bacterium]|nr:cyclic pyranopterin monophosphate synthase MoaC [Acidobacteriota bacterium]